MSGLIHKYMRGNSILVLIFICIKMHKVAKTRVVALVEKDNIDFITQKGS